MRSTKHEHYYHARLIATVFLKIMADIFICYSHKDAFVANRIADRLRAEGWDVFVDTNTQVGQRWHKQIESELHAARAIVALWSAASKESDHVLEEADYGRRNHILFPAFLQDVDAPYGFGQIQVADLIGWNGHESAPGLVSLIASLHKHLSSSNSRHFSDKLIRGGCGPVMVIVPPGKFIMGSAFSETGRQQTEGPRHEVTLDYPFAISIYTITFDQYDLFAEATSRRRTHDEGWGRGIKPAIHVAWSEARSYCEWLSSQTGRLYRLPSESEWEFACRAGTRTPFSFGAKIESDQANFDSTYTYGGSKHDLPRRQTVAVGTFPPNALGIHDMHGNVWEWCEDTWHPTFNGAPQDGSPWISEAPSHVMRGGSWGVGPSHCRTASRFHYPDPPPPDFNQTNKGGHFGFRVVAV
jgi:formylglycine-generating enzyme required for sulfatase activity